MVETLKFSEAMSADIIQDEKGNKVIVNRWPDGSIIENGPLDGLLETNGITLTCDFSMLEGDVASEDIKNLSDAWDQERDKFSYTLSASEFKDRLGDIHQELIAIDEANGWEFQPFSTDAVISVDEPSPLTALCKDKMQPDGPAR